MMKNRWYFLVLLTSICLFSRSHLLAQLENSNWIQTTNEPLSCNLIKIGFHPQVQVLTSAIANNLNCTRFSVFEGATAISDCNTGQFLFASNGKDLIKDNGEIININIGNTSTSQSIIIRKPGSCDTFFLFVPDAEEMRFGSSNHGLRYAIISKSLSRDLQIIQMPSYLHRRMVTEKLHATLHADGESIWLVGHEFGNNNFYSFLITKDGISPQPVISSVGEILDASTISSAQSDGQGEMKFSPDGKYLAYACLGSSKSQLLQFDNTTGILTNPININIDYQSYGISFSPNSKVLYVSQFDLLTTEPPFNGCIFQFDISIIDSAIINNSRYRIEESEQFSIYTSMKLDINNKLVVSQSRYNTLTDEWIFSQYFGIIDNPNIIGVNCNYRFEGLYLGSYNTPSYAVNNLQETFGPCPCEPEKKPVELALPNVFSPNHDGLNDTWPGTALPPLGGNGGLSDTTRVTIYSRWGVAVYSGPLHPGWDGRAPDGTPAPEGVYAYTLHTPAGQLRSGTVTLVR
jgi:gliding motility-associated-like protein